MAPRPDDLRNRAAWEAARTRQRKAAAPGSSVLLRAGAGSGKTHTLVDRFLRLCIEVPQVLGADPEGERDWPGIPPRSILAITFTRKAAVEIKSRLLERTRVLALAPADDLRAGLESLLGRSPRAGELRRAANLYERILEHPQGLKIGTIHQFCQQILGRFAPEAGLDPGYTVLEDTSELEEEALDEVERRLASDAGRVRDARLLGDSPAAIRSRLAGVFHSRLRLDRWRAGLQGDGAGPEAMREDLRARLFPGLQPGTEPSAASVLEDLAEALEEFAGPGLDGVRADLGSAADVLPPKAFTDLRTNAAAAATACVEAVARFRADPDISLEAAVTGAKRVLLTNAGSLRRFSRGRKDPELNERFQELVEAAGRDILAHLRTWDLLGLFRINAALLDLGLLVLETYAALKQRDRVVDFQDLEELARELMGDEARAVSLLFRLDDSITHIMVDEFQDTNFNQFEILQPLIDDFLGGGSGQAECPTVFFVGDVKQSIYGFRGAEPGLFRGLMQVFAERAEVGDPTEPCHARLLTLPTNFRSLEAITGGVGDLFSQPPLVGALGLAGDGDLVQLCHRREDRGEVKAWIIPPFSATDVGELSADQVAAREAARLVSGLVGRAVTWDKADPHRTRPLVWQDVLVLMRARSRAGLYEDAFRRAGIPINPSGRGALASTREVQDLLALLRWLVWPEDDIALSTVLRSPLFRWDQVAFQGALSRPGLLETDAERRAPLGLWRTLCDTAEDPVRGETVRLLKSWRERAGYEHCHDLVRRIYRETDALERYEAALGGQAVYNLERIHDLTLGHEMAAMPTVRGLIGLIERAGRRGTQEVGVVPETGDGGRVNFLTIHGAKGLEAPVVLYVDADRSSDKEDAEVVLDPDDSHSPLLLTSRKEGRRRTDGESDAVTLAVGAAADRRRTEDANLDYVALTRARDRLYILGGDTSTKNKEPDSALRRLMAAAGLADGDRIRVDLPPELQGEAADAPAQAAGHATGSGLPETRVPDLHPLPEPVRIVTPSSVAEGEALPREVGATVPGTGGIRHGLRVHALLEAAARLGSMAGGSGDAWREARDVFTAKDLAWVFHPEEVGGRGWSEVPLIARRDVPGDERITGVIDRLVLRPGRVDIIDYKTNRCAATAGLQDALAAHYRPQLELYREALALIHPERKVGIWLLFTDPDLDPGDRLVELAGSG